MHDAIAQARVESKGVTYAVRAGFLAAGNAELTFLGNQNKQCGIPN
jgi:hypothetical protein